MATPETGRRSPRIMLVVDSLDLGGTQRFAVVVASALVERGIDVVLVVHTSAEAVPDAYAPPSGALVVRLDRHWRGHSSIAAARNVFGSCRALRRCIGQHLPDAVVGLGTTMSVLVLMTGRRKPRIAITERIHPSYDIPSRVWRVGRSLLYRFADVLIAQTREIAGVCEEWIPSKRIRVMGNIAPDHLFERQWRQPADQSVVALGRLHHQKGFDTLISAFAHVVVELPQARLTIFGDGPEHENLRAMASDLGLEDSVTIPGPTNDPFGELERASAFVLSSRYEGFPNSLLEAMAIGMPVVSTDCPSGPRDLIEDSISGRLTPVEDPQALGQAIVEVLRDRESAQRLGDEARRSASRFRGENVIPQLLDILHVETAPQSEREDG